MEHSSSRQTRPPGLGLSVYYSRFGDIGHTRVNFRLVHQMPPAWLGRGLCASVSALPLTLGDKPTELLSRKKRLQF